LRNSGLGGVNLEIMRHVAGRLLALHADDTDHRLRNGRIVEPHRPHEGAVRRPVEPIGRHPRSPFLHGCLLPTPSFRDAPLDAGPESITTIGSMDSGLAPRKRRAPE